MAEHTAGKLSTDDEQACQQAVDDSIVVGANRALRPARSWWLGAVVPKRHARRAVTRTLIKRQIRAAFARHAAAGGSPLGGSGLWVVRLRAPFDRAAFTSAASGALRDAAISELDSVLAQAGRKLASALARG